MSVQSFVRDIATDPNDAIMVQTIIGLAQNFRLDVMLVPKGWKLRRN